jgi:hypothetical protein
MRVVDKPVKRPMHCAAIPFLGQVAEGERWVDPGVEMPGFDNHVYLSATAVRQASAALGYPSLMEFAAMRARAETAEEAALELADQLEAAELANEELRTALGVLRRPELAA